MTKCFLSAIFCVLGLIGREVRAATLPAGFSEATVNGPAGAAWDQAVGLRFEDNGRMYVWEKAGRVWFQEYGSSSWTLLLDLSEEVGNWDDFGLLGFALDPNFRVNGNIYLMYVVDRHHLLHFGKPEYSSATNEYNNATIGRITRYTARAADGFTSVDYTTRRVLLGESPTNGFPLLYTSHGLGSLVFGEDGTLLASCGDGASWSSVDVGSASETYYARALTDGIIQPKENVGAYRAQLVDSLNGKIVRLDPATGDGIPGNPFYDAANPRAARSRVWALGLRNPFRMTLRPGTGSHVRADANPGVLYIGDVGYEIWEDLDICRGPGQNFGWPVFEGIDAQPSYSSANVANLDAPNPAYPGAGCSQYFYFNQLIKQNTSVPANQPPFNNPCNPSQKIPSAIPQFLQTPPALDWKHGVTLARTWIYNGSGVATAINVGAAGSPVSGSMFPGNCSIGGVWYTGSDFPASYQNTYFHADYGANWIKSFVFDANDQPVSVTNFLASGGGIVAVATHPLDGGLYYIDINALALRKITYSVNGNQPPTAVALADQNYGPGPLSVQFTGNGSSDPEGGALTYDWNFGDGSAHSAAVSPAHLFTGAPGVPTKYNVTLTVTDDVAQTATATAIVSVNNTPPTVTITSPVDGSKYPMTGDTVYNLTATVTDLESPDEQLQYVWRTFLHHDNHEHPGPINTNHLGTTVISPVGCDGINIYYYRVELTVTDPAGLSRTRDVKIFPDCGTPDTPPVISNLPDQTIAQDQTTGPIGFTVSDVETATANLQLSGVSSDATLVPVGNIIFGDNGNNRTVTVNPAAGRNGTATITVTVNDGPNNTSTNFALTVQAAPLGITTTTLSNGIVNVAYVAKLTASGGTPPYSWSLTDGGLPPGLTLTTNSGSIRGTPMVAGSFNFTAQVSDASNPVQSVTKTLSLIVTTAPTTLGNTNEGTLTDAMGVGWINACRFQAVGNLTVNTMLAKVGAITGRYKCAIYTDNGSQPSRLLQSSAEVINPAAGWQTFPLTAPQALTNGQFYWLGIWSDSGNSRAYYSGTAGTIRWGNYAYGTWPDPLVTTGGGSLSYCIYATGPGLTATDLAVGMGENTSTNLTLLGSNVEGAVSFGILSGPTNGVLSGLDTNSGAVTYTPNLNYNGADAFRFTVSDGSLSATGLVSVTVTAVNDAPVATELVVGMVENTSTNLTLLGSDVDGVVSYAILSGPTNGVLSGLDANSGAVTYTPNLNYNGADAFRFTVSDGSLSATGLVSVTVTAVNDAPVATELVVETPEDTSTNLTLLGSDVEGAVSFGILSGPTNGVLSGLDANSGAVTYTPNLNYNGVDAFRFTVSDGSLSATGLVSVTVTAVNDAPVATELVVETPEDTSTNLTLLGSDVEGAVSFGILSGPTNGVLSGLDTNSGAVTYTPNLNYNGVDAFRFTVSDGSLSATGLVSVTVTAVNDAPVATELVVETPEDTSTNLTFLGSDVEGAVSFGILSGPTNGVLSGLDTNSGAVTYTPNLNYNGVDAFRFTVSDGSLSATGLVSVTVTAVNDAPVATELVVGMVENTSTNLTLLGSDVDGVVSFAILSGPTNGVLSGLDTNSGAVTYTPNLNYNGVDAFRFTVSDGSLSATGLVSVTVTAVNDAPVATELVVETPEDTSTNLTLLGSDVDGVVSFAILSGPTNGVLSGLDTNSGAVTYTPNLNYNGVDAFRFTVSDGSLSATGLVSVTVTAVNDPPVATELVVETPEDTSTNLTLLGSDVDGVVSFAILSGPTNGVLSGLDTNSGAVTYTPNLNYNGADAFRFTVSDGSLSATGLVSVTVTAVNDPPVATELVVETPEDTSTNLTLLGSDVDGVVSFAILSGPTNGVLSGLDTNSGAVTYTPNLNYNGVDAFRFTVSDGSLSATGLVSVTVTPVNDAPVANDDNFNLGDGVVLDISAPGVLANDSDAEGDNLTAILVSGPLQGALNLDPGGGFNYTPTNHFSGVDTFTYQVSDGQTNSETATVNIAVSNKIQISSIVLADGVVTLNWTSIIGKIYRLQYKDSWIDVDWQDASADVTAVGSDTTGTNAVETATQRFYRVLCLGNN